MSETEEVKDSQKTVVSFIAGLIVGALLLWMFGCTAEQDVKDAANATGDVADEAGDAASELADDAVTYVDDVRETVTSEVSEAVASLTVGDAAVSLESEAAGSRLDFSSITFPTDAGWIAVRSYNNGALGNVLGASRYSKEQGLVPQAIELLTPTTAGQEYAVVFFSENGDRQFNMRSDFQLDVDPVVFTAE